MMKLARRILIFGLILISLVFQSCRRAEQTAEEIGQLAQTNSPVMNPTNAELEAVKTPCDDVAPAEAENCLRTEFERTEQELNQLYNKILDDLAAFQTRARTQDESLAEKYKTDAETLRFAEDYWVNYRKFNCKAEREMNLNAAESVAAGLSCFQRMTEERIENLKAIYENK